MHKPNYLFFNTICGGFIALPIITVFAGRFMEAVVPFLSLLAIFYWIKTNQFTLIKSRIVEGSKDIIWLSLLGFLAIAFLSLQHGIQNYGNFKQYILILLTVMTSIIASIFLIDMDEKRFFRNFTYAMITASFLTVFFIFSFNKIDLVTNTFKSLHLFNRVAAALAIWSVPLIYIMRGDRLLQIALIVSVCLVSIYSDSGTAPFILMLSSLSFILTLTLKKPFILLCAIFFFLVILFLPFIATLPKLFISNEIHNAMNKASTHHRAELWSSYALLAQQKWFTGWGFEASRTAIINPLITPQFKDPNFSLGSHPHMMLLQIYFEQGILAIIALLTGFYGLCRKILKLEPMKAAVCVASFVGVIAMTAVNFSIWQQWIIVMIGIQAAFCVYLARDAHTGG